MKETHPKQYDYIMRSVDKGGLNYKEIIDWVNYPPPKGSGFPQPNRIYEKPISRVLESNHKPEKFTHNLEYLYKMIYPACNRNMPLPKFDYDFSDSLKGIFLDFQATRFPLDADNPSESYKRREVTDNAAQYDAEILKQTKNLTIECRQVLFEIKKSQQELKDKS